MQSPTLDPTAGERARRARLEPAAVEPVTDPTDPRYGRFSPAAPELAGDVGRIVDPTDPDCGQRPA
jgi:hypothetical protein